MRIRTGALLAPLAALALAACSGSPTPSSTTASAPGSAPASASASTSYRMSDVAQHNTQQDCWAAIDGDVYNLTSWISQHPGGSDKIIPLCGTDATSAFRNQHGSQEKPNAQLASFKIGTLVD